MAVPTVEHSRIYDGNNSSVASYSIPYPFLSAGDIKVAVKPSGGAFALLTPGEYTVSRLADGSGGSVVTTAPVPASSRVRVFRSTPKIQPMTLSLTGAMRPPVIEQSADRNTMLIQELAARVDSIEEGLASEGIVNAPPELALTLVSFEDGNVTLTNGVTTFTVAAVRVATVSPVPGALTLVSVTEGNAILTNGIQTFSVPVGAASINP